MKKSILRCTLAGLLSLAGVAAAQPATAVAPRLVVLVRHAEKAAEPVVDPGLSTAGAQRALALAEALEHAGIEAIITTQFRRTRETAQPLAMRLKLEPLVVSARREAADAHVPEVLAAIRSQHGNVLVVGHSNTLAAIVAGLGGPALPDLCETSFGQAWVLSGAALLRLRYGVPDAPAQGDCQ